MSTTSEIVSSAADSFTGNLDTDGFSTTIAPFASVSGGAPPAYFHRKAVAYFQHAYGLSPAESNSLTLSAQTAGFVDTAVSAGFGIDAISARGSAYLGSASFALVDSPLSTLSVLGLSVQATGVRSESDASFVFGPNEGFLTGDARFRSLEITGALVGGKTLKFSGDAAPDTVLYSSATVTITLDEQRLLLPPAGANSVIGPSITTDAIDIRFNGAKFFGHTLSGDFVIGQSSASYSLFHI